MARVDSDNPIEIALTNLNSEIETFKSLYPGYISPEYERQYLQNFREYLLELDQLEKETALEIIKTGKEFAQDLLDCVGKNIGSVGLIEEIDNFPKDLSKSRVLKSAVETSDPERFGHDPYVDAGHNKKARRYWYEFIQLNKHQIAENYIQRKDRVFKRVEVFGIYKSLREDGQSVENAFNELKKRIESYGVDLLKVQEQIGLSLFDKDTFNRAYNRWKKDS